MRTAFPSTRTFRSCNGLGMKTSKSTTSSTGRAAAVYRVIDANLERGEPVDRLEFVGIIFRQLIDLVLARPVTLINADGHCRTDRRNTNLASTSQVAEYFRRIGETLDVVKWQPLHYVAAGELVAVFGSMSLRTKANGETVLDSPWALDFTVASGKITGWQVYVDTAVMERALLASTASL
jgi:ketosteroid isomerase-like protein